MEGRDTRDTVVNMMTLYGRTNFTKRFPTCMLFFVFNGKCFANAVGLKVLNTFIL